MAAGAGMHGMRQLARSTAQFGISCLGGYSAVMSRGCPARLLAHPLALSYLLRTARTERQSARRRAPRLPVFKCVTPGMCTFMEIMLGE